MTIFILVTVSFVISLVIVDSLRQPFAQHLLDVPNGRSSHTMPTPRGGGVGFLLAFAVISWSIIWLNWLAEKQVIPGLPTSITELVISLQPLCCWLVLLPLAIVGFLDDRSHISATGRYLVQISCAALAVTYFGAFPQPWLIPLGMVGQIVAIALTIIGFTALVNFYNFMDGLDGLVASVTAAQLSFLAFYLNQPLWWLLVGALLGFLWWNWSPARIFMGDVGSTVLGACVAIALLQADRPPLVAWSALAICLPLLGDAIYTLICRLSRRENIFTAHRSHLYQRLHQSGWSHGQVSLTYLLITLIIAGLIFSLSSFGAILSLGVTAIGLWLGEWRLRSGTPQPEGQNQ
ncbi:MAG TPA: glycosyltransferase family 4 protein [Coleofasciculaceae cyanobacterium]